MEKKLSDITRQEWICYHWLECTPTDDDRVFLQHYRKTPDEAAKAAEDWDMTADDRGAIQE